MRGLLGLSLLLIGCGGASELTEHELTEHEPAQAAPAAGAGGGAVAAGGTRAASGGGGATGGSDAGLPACPAGDLTLEDPSVVDWDVDGVFEPGERIGVSAYVRNAGAAKSVVVLEVTSDDARVSPPNPPHVPLGGLEAGARVPAAVPFLISDELWDAAEVGFTLRAFERSNPSCASEPLEHVIIVSTYGWDVDTCDATRQLELSTPYVVDGDGDGWVEPGEDLDLLVTLSNPGPLDHVWYPGVRFTATHPDVTPAGDASDWHYAMPAGTSGLMGGRFHVDAGIAPGTTLSFTLVPAALNLRCRNVRTLEYSLLVQ